MMHAVMMTSHPGLMYWLPATLTVIEKVRQWRSDGLQAAFTIDAGPNVHVICAQADASKVKARLAKVTGVSKVLSAGPGGPTRLMNNHLTT
jgi:diphosphomevalonate decarboxylase